MTMFYVEIKNDAGEYEPVGMMSLEAALEYSWTHQHRAIHVQKVSSRSEDEG